MNKKGYSKISPTHGKSLKYFAVPLVFTDDGGVVRQPYPSRVSAVSRLSGLVLKWRGRAPAVGQPGISRIKFERPDL